MTAIGLSFGSPTSGQGFDVSATVDKIVASMRSAEDPYKAQLTSRQSQDTALSNIGTLLGTLSTDIAGLTDFQGVLASKNGSSSNTSVLTLTNASTAAVAGTHTVTVSKMAQTSSTYSGALASTDVLSGSISIQVGSGTAHSVPVDPKNQTIAGLAAAINLADIGVSASVVKGAGGQVLSLVSQTGGSLGQLTIDSHSLLNTTKSNAAVQFAAGQSGIDAELTVDGVAVISSSNSVSNAIKGVTFQVTGTTENPVQVVITNDVSSVSSALSTLVTDYNAVVKELNTQEGKDAAGKAEPLYGSTVLTTLQSTLQSLFRYSGSSGIPAPSSLGLEIQNDGTLKLNTDTLAAALNNQFKDVVSFFQNADSFGVTFRNSVNNLGASQSTGLITLSLKENAQIEDGLNQTVAKLEDHIGQQQARLITQLNAANQTLQMIPTLLNSVDQLYAAITGYNPKR